MKLICGLVLACLSLQAADNKKTSPDGVHRGSMFTGKTHALGGGRPTVSGQSTAAASAAAPATSMPSSSPQQRSVVAPFNLPTAAPVAGATTPASVSPTASRAGSPTNTPAAAAATPTTSPVATAAPQHAAVPLLRLPRQSVYSATSHALGGPRRSSTAASEASAAAASAATAAAAHAGSASSAVTLARHKQNTGSPRSGIAGKSMIDEIGGRMAVIVEDNKNLLNELMSKVDFFVHREQDFDRIIHDVQQEYLKLRDETRKIENELSRARMTLPQLANMELPELKEVSEAKRANEFKTDIEHIKRVHGTFDTCIAQLTKQFELTMRELKNVLSITEQQRIYKSRIAQAVSDLGVSVGQLQKTFSGIDHFHTKDAIAKKDKHAESMAVVGDSAEFKELSAHYAHLFHLFGTFNEYLENYTENAQNMIGVTQDMLREYRNLRDDYAAVHTGPVPVEPDVPELVSPRIPRDVLESRDRINDLLLKLKENARDASKVLISQRGKRSLIRELERQIDAYRPYKAELDKIKSKVDKIKKRLGVE